MNIVKKILFPVDFSKCSETSIEYVLGLAKSDSNMECTLLHITGNNEDAQPLLKNINDQKKKFSDEGIKCEAFIESGLINEVIIDFWKKTGIDLIVMGTTGSNRDLETHTTKLLQEVDCPVLIIPDGNKDFQMRSIALAIDDKEFDDATDLQLFHDIAKWFDTKVHLLKVDNGNNKSESVSEEKEKTLEYYMQSLEYQYSFPQNRNIEKGIQDYIKEHKIDTLAIIPRSNAKKSVSSEGKLTKVLAQHSNIPLLVLA